MGKILLVDLTSESFEEYPFTDQQREETLGGKAMAYRILADQLTGEEQAFSEDNLLILSTGPLTGTGAPGSDRFEITAISPKSGVPASSNCGGCFGTFLKKAGYDALILRGRCKTSRWLDIRENNIRFRDAACLWGLGTESCLQQLTKELPGVPLGYLCIGPAGEDLLTGATIISDGRSAGRAGFGAVLGWKKLKAVTVTGSQPIRLHDPQKSAAEIRKWARIIQENPLTADSSKISSCPGCPIHCKRPGKGSDPVLNDLGMDSIDAEKHFVWLREKHGITLKSTAGKKSGQRRNQFYQSILHSAGLRDCEAVFNAYQNMTELISASGLCIFAVIPCLDLGTGNSIFLSERLPLLLQNSTGILFTPEDLLAIGKHTLELRDALRHRFAVKLKSK